MKKLLFILLLILLSTITYAHQPKLGCKNVEIIEPTISKAYYGTLRGEPHYYLLNLKNETPVYLNLLIPGKEFTHTISAEIQETDIILNSSTHNWTVYYEEYGKDYYMKGPEFGKDFKATTKLQKGTYKIKVFNNNNKGKYVLAVGDIESFPKIEILKTIIILPYLKIFFFNKYHLLLIPIFIILLIYYGKNKFSKSKKAR